MDPKIADGRQTVLYIPLDFEPSQALRNLSFECNVRVQALPNRIHHLGDISASALNQHGLLYLPNPYVVPGGRFNEMYGWDSYFIIRGLLEDGQRALARGMIENFFFEIEHYGAVLNANRTYYLTRSQPPFLSSMILALYEADRKAGEDDRAWLERAYEYAKRDHDLWTTGPKLDMSTGLSRYYDFGDGPVPEIGDHPDYYVTVADWLVKHPEVHTGYITPDATRGAPPPMQVPRCGSAPCKHARTMWFTPDYYKGDRAMRESGFDISFRFGPFGGSTHHYAPVCLNGLLFKAEKDLEYMATKLDRTYEARKWRQRASRRRRLVNRYLWNAKLGMFFDYDLRHHVQSKARYATMFYPLWTGLATAEQARAVMRHIAIFEQPGGLAMSDRETGLQWDKPYGWAPIQMLAVEAMRRYGFQKDADRVSAKFLTMVVQNLRKEGTIREKYNVVNRSTETAVNAGYKTNVVGFGWTNGAFVVLLHGLSPRDRQTVLAKPEPTTENKGAIFPTETPPAQLPVQSPN